MSKELIRPAVTHPPGTYGMQWRMSLDTVDLILELHAPAA